MAHRLGWPASNGDSFVTSGLKAHKELASTFNSLQTSLLGMPAASTFAVRGIPHIFGFPDAIVPRPRDWPEGYVMTTGFWWVWYWRRRYRRCP